MERTDTPVSPNRAVIRQWDADATFLVTFFVPPAGAIITADSLRRLRRSGSAALVVLSSVVYCTSLGFLLEMVTPRAFWARTILGAVPYVGAVAFAHGLREYVGRAVAAVRGEEIKAWSFGRTVVAGGALASAFVAAYAKWS